MIKTRILGIAGAPTAAVKSDLAMLYDSLEGVVPSDLLMFYDSLEGTVSVDLDLLYDTLAGGAVSVDLVLPWSSTLQVPLALLFDVPVAHPAVVADLFL